MSPCAGFRRALTCAGGGRQGYRQDILTPERKWRYYGLISYATVGSGNPTCLINSNSRCCKWGVMIDRRANTKDWLLVYPEKDCRRGLVVIPDQGSTLKLL